MLARTKDNCIIFDVPFSSLDMINVESFKKNILKVYLSSQFTDMVLNLRKVNYIDASGLEALLFAACLVQQSGGRISLYGLHPYVKQVLLKTRFYKYFDINRTEAECLEFIKDNEIAIMCNYQKLRSKLKAKPA